MLRTLFLILFVSAQFFCSAQKDTIPRKKRTLYATWGYTRAWYSKSTIHFKDLSGKYHPATGNKNYYDFTVHNAVAHDRPDFDRIKDVINITIPQFVFRIGYQINNKWDAELNYDHAKYVVDNWQHVHVTGQIFGKEINGDSILNPDKFLHFEHTDGANFWMFNAVRKWSFFNKTKNINCQFVLKPGAGFVYPRTDVTLFGENLNNNWHISGWIVGVESGLRLEFVKHGFFEFVGKGAYANYVKALVLGKGNGSANHKFWVCQLTATAGYKLSTRK